MHPPLGVTGALTRRAGRGPEEPVPAVGQRHHLLAVQPLASCLTSPSLEASRGLTGRGQLPAGSLQVTPKVLSTEPGAARGQTVLARLVKDTAARSDVCADTAPRRADSGRLCRTPRALHRGAGRARWGREHGHACRAGGQPHGATLCPVPAAPVDPPDPSVLPRSWGAPHPKKSKTELPGTHDPASIYRRVTSRPAG